MAEFTADRAKLREVEGDVANYHVCEARRGAPNFECEEVTALKGEKPSPGWDAVGVTLDNAGFPASLSKER